jgi:hypothetical protein
VAVGLFYHGTWNEYEDHFWFGFETGRIARVGQISRATG